MSSNVENRQQFGAEPKEAHISGIWDKQDSDAGVKLIEWSLKSNFTSVKRSIKNSIEKPSRYLRRKEIFEYGSL